MEENVKETSLKKTVIVSIILIAALVAGVKLIFAAMEVVMPKTWAAQIWDEMLTEKGTSALYDLRMLSVEELEQYESRDVANWLAFAQDDEVGDAYWLCRKDTQEYVLYIPEQDRVLENADLSASEETMPDGRVTLVLRARTPEDGVEIEPEEQLFCIKSKSDTWDGQRLKLILDGREQEIVQATSRGEKVYSADGEEIEVG